MAENSVMNNVAETMQHATGYEQKEPTNNGISILNRLVKAGDLLPPWWSPRRDIALASFWKSSDHLSSAVYNSQAKLVGIPFEIVARDPSNVDHVEMAENMTDHLMHLSEFGLGWLHAYEKFIEDLLTKDNGAFFEIIGLGNPDGPIVGAPISIRHLDSLRCTRTGNPEFPVVYLAEDDKRYKLHWTRVISLSQMPSSDSDMNGVGFSAVSRSANVAQTLIDVVTYKQEKLGSRPQSQIVVGKGITGEQIMEAFWHSDEGADNSSRRRFAKTTAIGSESPDIDVEVISLNHNDPFDESVSITLGMFAIAVAFGMDASELWPTGGGSSSKADSSLRRMRSRGKLPAQTTSSLESQFNMKFLPPFLKMRFDFKDDEEDQQRAIIQDIRARNRERDLESGTTIVRIARQRMLDDGDLDRNEFNMMEIEDGRLPDGQEVGVLFFSDEPVFDRHLSPLQELLIVRENIDPIDTGLEDKRTESLIKLQRSKSGVLKELAMTSSDKKRGQLKMATHALNWLSDRYEIEGKNEFFDKIPPSMRRFTTDQIYQERTDKRPGEARAGEVQEDGENTGNPDIRDRAGTTQRESIRGDNSSIGN